MHDNYVVFSGNYIFWPLFDFFGPLQKILL